jgi:hypothetical protein
MPSPHVLADDRMRCSHCHCQMTAERSADVAALRCPECQTTPPPGQSRPTATAGAWPPHLNDPELADDLRQARRLLRIDQAHADHQPLGLAALLAGERAERSAAQRGDKQRRRRQKMSGGSLGTFWGGLTWLVVCAGGMGLTFGAALLACAQLLQHHVLHVGPLAGGLAKRDDLWNWGLLTALAGQFLLFLGFALRRRSKGRVSSQGSSTSKRRSRDDETPRPPPRLSPTTPLWSPRCEAVLGLSLDSLDRV